MSRLELLKPKATAASFMDPIRQCHRLIFALVLLSIVSFCLAEQNVTMLLLAGFAAAVAWVLTESSRGRPLPGWMVNVGALGILAWLLFRVYWRDDNMVFAAGHFTMWLQIIVLYRKKTNREFGQLLVLSVVQMMAASVVSYSLYYGLLLMAYCILALGEVLTLQLKASHDRVMQANGSAALCDEFAPAPQPIAGRRHRWHFRIAAVLIAMVCMAVSLVVFVAIPRRETSHRPRNSSLAGIAKKIGFTEKVSLNGGRLGEGSNKAVLNLRITEDGKPVGGSNQPLLVRGAALDEYQPNKHTWTRSYNISQQDNPRQLFVADSDLPSPIEPSADLAWLARSVPLRTVDVTLYQGGGTVLFTLYPKPIWIYSDQISSIKFNPLDQRLWGQVEGDEATYEFRMPSKPQPHMTERYRSGPFGTDAHVRAYARGWPVQEDRVRDFALQILAKHGLKRNPRRAHTKNDQRIAQTLADYLSQEYRYTLDNPRLGGDQDPVITFLFDRKSGHCELFAAAHAAMCRSIGIPARIITGYRASEYNDLGSYYVVRERNAHAWTEVDCGPEIGWRPFEPTPAAAVQAEHEPGTGVLRGVRDVYGYLQHAWLETVVAFDPGNRKQFIGVIRTFILQPAQHAIQWIGQTFGLIDGASAIAQPQSPDTPAHRRHHHRPASGAGEFSSRPYSPTPTPERPALNELPAPERRRLARRVTFYITMLEMLEQAGYVRP